MLAQVLHQSTIQSACASYSRCRNQRDAPKRRKTFPSRKPDIDKLLRSTLDALTEAGVFTDDARVVEFTRLAKVFPGEDPEALDAPGVRITVERFSA